MTLPAMGIGYNLKQEIRAKLHWFGTEAKTKQTARLNLPGIPDFEIDMNKLKEDHMKKMARLDQPEEDNDRP